jgi:hypothetical protein
MSNINVWAIADEVFISTQSLYLDRVTTTVVGSGADYVILALKDPGRVAILSGTFTSNNGILSGTISRYTIESNTSHYDVVISGLEGLTLAAFTKYVETNTTTDLWNLWMSKNVTFIGNISSYLSTTMSTSIGDDYLSGSSGHNYLDAGNGNNVVFTYESKDTILCGSGNDSVSAGAGEDFVSTGAGKDTIDGGTGNDTIDAGNGVDIVLFTGTRAEHTIADRTALWVVGPVGSNADGTDTLIGVERLKFSDVSLAIDLVAPNSAGGVYRLYGAAFNRKPDAVGLGYWIAKADDGESATAMATDFTYSKEFQALYATNITDNYATGANVTNLVTGFYTNVLHRAPDVFARDWYANQISTHQKTVGQVLAEISDSPENIAQLAGVIANGIVYTPWHG